MLMTSLLMLLLVLGPSAGAIDHGAWQKVMDLHVDPSSDVNYAAVKADDLLDTYVAGLGTARPPADRAGKLAFWMNAYNALTVDMVADAWPLESIRDLDGGDPWSKRQFTVAGRSVTLDEIEHEILRPLGDPRIHAGVNCASRGCPPLHRSAFTADNVDKELEKASARWAATSAVLLDHGRKKVLLNKIFDWYGEDFKAGAVEDLPRVTGKQEAALVFLLPHLSESDRTFIRTGEYSVGWQPYSWRVNAQ